MTGSDADRSILPAAPSAGSAQDEDAAAAADGWVSARAQGTGYRTELHAPGGHQFVADEPVAVGGSGDGATPYDYLLASLAACTAMTVRMYADRKGWPLEDVVVRLRTANTHAADCAECESKPTGVGPRRLERRIVFRGVLDDTQRARLLAIADRCPVKQTLERGLVVDAVPAA